MESAHAILNVMMQAGLEPSADTYTTLLCGYASKGDINKIMELIEECENKEIFLLDKDYLDIVYSLATSGYTEHVPTILSKVRRAVGYVQDAINVILRLINKGNEEAAFMVLKSMPRATRDDGTTAPTGHFFIRQLVRANRPLEKIVELCNTLEQEGLYERAFLTATECSLHLGNEKLAYPLLEILRKRGQPIRQHFFWPLIVSKAKDASGKAVVEVLRKMSDFNIYPNNETLREYVIPNLKGSSSDILALLRDGNVSVASAACSLVHSLLQKYMIADAAEIASTVPAYYFPELIRRPLTNAFYSTNDIKSYITLVRTIYENADRKSIMQNQEDLGEDIDKASLVSSFLWDLASNSSKFLEKIETVLEELVKEGLCITNTTAEKIEAKLGEKMTEKISTLLGKLSSGELTPVPLARKPATYVPTHLMTIPQLERLIQNLSAKGQETYGLKRQLLSLYYREKHLEKTEKILEELQTDSGFVFTIGLYAQMMDLYAHHDKLDKALYYYEKIKETQKDFALNETKIVRLANVLIKSGRFDDCIKILNETPAENAQENRVYTYTALVWRMLNSLAEDGEVEKLNTLFDVLVTKGFIDANNVYLGPLIKVHLVRKEIDKALEKFEWCVNQFKATPWKNELACQLIQSEDADKLQKLTDLSTSVHGEVNSLYDLVFAFVECGRIRQARKILETPGLQNRPRKINNACERYQEEGLVKPLEGLKDATKDLNHIDRSDIYYQLLLSYIKQEEVDKALGLWTQMQEEDLAPSDVFLNTLGKFLRERGRDVPFVVPSAPQKRQQPPITAQPSTASHQLFKEKIQHGLLDEALEIKKRSNDKFSVTDLSALIEKLLQANRVSDASSLAFVLLDRGNLPLNRVFRFLLNRLASNGDIETLTKIGSKISKDVKKIVSFDNRMCHAYLVAGKVEEYLDKLKEHIDTVTEANLTNISEQFPRGGAYGILEKHPEMLDKCMYTYIIVF